MKLFALLVLVNSCTTLDIPEPPNVDLCSMIKGTDYLLCAPYFYEGNSYKVHVDEAFDKKYFAVSPRHFAEVEKYLRQLERLAEKRCQ